MAWDLQKRLLWLPCGALCLNVLSNFVLIPHYGHMGAAMATLASRGLIFALCTVWMAARVREVTGSKNSSEILWKSTLL